MYPASTRNCTLRRIVALTCILCDGNTTSPAARVAVVKLNGPLRLLSSPEVLRGLVSVLLGYMTDKATGLGTSRRENTLKSLQEIVEHHLDETDHRRGVYSMPTLSSLFPRP